MLILLDILLAQCNNFGFDLVQICIADLGTGHILMAAAAQGLHDDLDIHLARRTGADADRILIQLEHDDAHLHVLDAQQRIGRLRRDDLDVRPHAADLADDETARIVLRSRLRPRERQKFFVSTTMPE